MKYTNITQAIFCFRPNRFIAEVEINGIGETVHVKNTGRCRELLIPGTKVILEKSGNPNRKTKYDLIGVYRDNMRLINMDSQAPNQVVKEWLTAQQQGKTPLNNTIWNDITYIKPEYTHGNSRIDFYYERGEQKGLIEVKGVTLEKNGIGYFPDAPTQRGIKHIEELERARLDGYESTIAFVIQMEGIDMVLPNDDTHPEFGKALYRAHQSGVNILYLGCQVTENELIINRVKSMNND